MQAKMPIVALVERFATETVAQLSSTDHREGNRHAKHCVKAFKTLIDEYGNAGREALSVLFTNPNLSVRVRAAAFLLRYMHEDAMQVLNELAMRDDMVGFCASQTIKNWNDGVWELDPV